MAIRKANLKHLFRRRESQVVGYLLATGVILAAAGAVASMMHPALMRPPFRYVAGILAGSLQVEVLTKSLAYYFPECAKMLVRISFTISLIAALW